MAHELLKTLISEMVETYLEESYEDDLIESIFEEVSSETWEAIEEAILNELSPELLSRYANKAHKQYNKSDKDSYTAAKETTRQKHKDRMVRRNKGLGSVLKRGMVADMERGRDVYVPKAFRPAAENPQVYKQRSLTGKTPEQMKKDREK